MEDGAGTSSALYANPIAFSDFCMLLQKIRTIKPRRTSQPRHQSWKELEYTRKWIHLARQEYAELPTGTIVIFFRLLFPDEGVRRRYDLREQSVASHLEAYFRTSAARFAGWSKTSMEQRGSSTGCLGAHVEAFLDKSQRRLPARQGGLTLGRVDELLDELASLSQWSSKSVRDISSSRSVDAILKDLLDPLEASEIAFMIQIILRDLAPLLYSPPTTCTKSLLDFTSTSYRAIEVDQALKLWHEEGSSMYCITHDLDHVAFALESMHSHSPKIWNPTIGKMINRPTSVRPGTCKNATAGLSGDVAVETKYDGERLQIHIDLSLPFDRQIQIFSKSGRDSTEDRRRLKPIIRAALGLHLPCCISPLLLDRLSTASYPANRPSIQTLIIEGEMVPYNETDSRIDEFWTLEQFRRGGRATPASGVLSESQESVETGHSGEDSPARAPGKTLKGTDEDVHLMIVWFDVLLLNGESLLHQTVENILRVLLAQYLAMYASTLSASLSVSQPELQSILAENTIINFDVRERALQDLRLHFAQIIVARNEGLMLKPLAGRYHEKDKGRQWVKLKKDFIPGAGDTKDFHVVGASWQRERGRSLGVSPSVLTTFFVGLRSDAMGPRCLTQVHNKPHYHVLFAVSYGLTRAQLESLNFSVRSKNPVPFAIESGVSDFDAVQAERRIHPVVYISPSIDFTFSIAQDLTPKSRRPTIMFQAPRVFELNGAGFQKHPESPYYSLRWPRITKVDHDGAPLSLAELQSVAVEAMRKTGTASQEEQSMLWASFRASISGEAFDGSVQRSEINEVGEWMKKLEEADRVFDGASKNLLEVPAPTVGRKEPLRRSVSDSGPRSTTRKEDGTAERPPKRVKASGRTIALRITESDVDRLLGEVSLDAFPTSRLATPPTLQRRNTDNPSTAPSGAGGVSEMWRGTKQSAASSSAVESPIMRPLKRVASSPSPTLLDPFRSITRTFDRPPPPFIPSSSRPPSPSYSSSPSHLASPSTRSSSPCRIATPISSESQSFTRCWSFYPPQLSAPVLPFTSGSLATSSYLLDPSNVLHACGYPLSPPRVEAPPHSHNQVRGVIFVDSAEREHELRALVDSDSSEKEEEGRVWLIEQRWYPDLLRGSKWDDLEPWVFAIL